MIFKNFKKIFCIYLLSFASLIFTSYTESFIKNCCCCLFYQNNTLPNHEFYRNTIVNQIETLSNSGSIEDRRVNDHNSVASDNSNRSSVITIIFMTPEQDELEQGRPSGEIIQIIPINNNLDNTSSSSTHDNTSSSSAHRRDMPITPREIISPNNNSISYETHRNREQATAAYTQQFSTRGRTPSYQTNTSVHVPSMD